MCLNRSEYTSTIYPIFLIIYLFTGIAPAQNGDTNHDVENNHYSHVDQHMNHLQVFIGGTALYENRGTYLSLGLDYLRVLPSTRDWAAGLFAEVIFAKHPEWIFGLLLYRRVYDQFFLRTGPGIEILRHEEIDPECNCVHVKSETEFLYRIGIGYSFHKNSMVITPPIDVDLVRSETALVFGVNVGFSFRTTLLVQNINETVEIGRILLWKRKCLGG